MGKPLYIAEKPSVAAEFAKALKLNTSRKDGYVEAENGIVTWCVGHTVFRYQIRALPVPTHDFGRFMTRD